jgi:hypothetical protein
MYVLVRSWVDELHYATTTEMADKPTWNGHRQACRRYMPEALSLAVSRIEGHPSNIAAFHKAPSLDKAIDDGMQAWVSDKADQAEFSLLYSLAKLGGSVATNQPQLPQACGSPRK